jgi:probable F420-dependent oxidoreductase
VAFIARKAEELGFESLWYAEHPILPVHSDSPFPATGGAIPDTYRHFTDPFIALARASGVTSKIKLGTGITLVPERNPLVLAKEIAALDQFSGGRFLFGIGAGWHREETTIMGGDFEHRWAQTREAIMAMKELWTKDEAEYHGHYYDFPPVYCYPKPAQKPHPPVILGGHARNVLQRVVRWGDGWLPNRADPAQIEESRKILDTLAAERGRDPGSISISVYGQPADRDLIQSYLNAGADRVVVRPEHCETEAQMGEQLERMAEAVIR